MSEDTEPTGGLGGGSVDQEASEPSTSPSQFDFSSEDAYGQFYESLPEELQAHDTLRNTKSIHALADQLVNAQSALGNKRLQAPQEDWGDEQWEDFYNQIRPENGEYSVSDELSFEGAESTPDFADETIQELVDFSAEMGLSQKQFDILYERYAQMAVDGQDRMSAETQDLVANHRQSIQGEWGEKYESNLAEANQAYEALASEIPELRELIDSDPVVANHPAVLKVFHRIAEVSGDALPLAENNPTSGFAAENIHGIKSAIQELDSSHAELIMSDPASLNMADRTKRQQILDQRAKLYSNLYPSD
jgi:hypothetical protein